MRATLRNAFRLSVVAIVALVGAPSHATTMQYATVGSWQIRVDPNAGYGCFTYAVFDGGASLRFALDFRSEAGSPLFVVLGNPEWASIEYGKDYPIAIRFGRKKRWTAEATGYSFEPPKDQTYLRFEVKRSQIKDFLDDFMRQTHVAFDYQGKEILNLTLRDSYKAGLKLIECQKEVNEIAAEASKKKDPFNNAASPKKDPFH